MWFFTKILRLTTWTKLLTHNLLILQFAIRKFTHSCFFSKRNLSSAVKYPKSPQDGEKRPWLRGKWYLVSRKYVTVMHANCSRSLAWVVSRRSFLLSWFVVYLLCKVLLIQWCLEMRVGFVSWPCKLLKLSFRFEINWNANNSFRPIPNKKW